MRDLIVAAAVFGSLPFILYRPWFGILVWAWLGYMNPHRLAWGFATEMPFALIVAVTTFCAILMSSEKKEIVWTRETKLLLAFTCWMLLTTVFSMYPYLAWDQWDKVWRIMLMTFVTVMLINSRERVHWLIVVIALSLAFYGVKGGLFVLRGGSVHNVVGPPASFISDRNSIGLAMIMTIPLLWYVRMQTKAAWLRLLLLVTTGLTAISIIGTHSRGALVGILVMGLFFLMKARNRLNLLLIMVPVVFIVLSVMPEEYFNRMQTIQTYEEDASAQGRLYAWGNAVELASMRFLGGGFRSLAAWGGTDSHSNWFGVLGEHGWVGLLMFVLLHVFTWRTASEIIRLTKSAGQLMWAQDLARMVQVSLVGYMSAGSFLGLQYFDLFYHLVVLIAITANLVRSELAKQAPAKTERLLPMDGPRYGGSLTRIKAG